MSSPHHLPWENQPVPEVTDKARPLVGQLKAVGSRLVAQAFDGIDPKDIETARRMLARVRDNAGRIAAADSDANRAVNE